MEQILIAALLIGSVGLVLGAIIALAGKIFKVEQDPRIDLVIELLPGANCGGCGKAGCADFAKSVVAGETPPGMCPVNSAENSSAIALALGMEAGGIEKKYAVVKCGGDINQVNMHILYNGVKDCVSASLIAGGPKGCAYGCLGLSSCARSCPFGAIEMINNLAVVHKELCVGCGKCVNSCPRKLISLVPEASEVHVYCNSPAKGIVKKQLCRVPCIGCRKCLRSCEGKFEVNGFLAQVNYNADTLPDAVDLENIKCPTGCLLSVGRHLEIEQNDPDWSETNHG